MLVSRMASLGEILSKRVLVLDGAMGTMIQSFGLQPQDYNRPWAGVYSATGCNEVLNLFRPDIIRDIHRQYIEAGADIITTNTFGANSITLSLYSLEEKTKEINSTAAFLAREEARAGREKYGRQILVAGTMGPTGKSASMSPDASDPGARDVSYDQLYEAFKSQALALIGGGVDIILIETAFDTLNVKAALAAVRDAIGSIGVATKSSRTLDRVAVMLSMTVAGRDGRLLSGQTIEAFVASVDFAGVDVMGLNCAFGAKEMLPLVERLATKAPCYISAHPNAGLPNSLGGYDQTPELFAEELSHMLSKGLLNIVGGCCGTTPRHIAALVPLALDSRPHAVPHLPEELVLSGLEPLRICREDMFVSVGERCNVAGSRKFLRLIKEKNYEEAVGIARSQVDAGAQILDINMDDALLEAGGEMEHFLRLIGSEPDIARVPVMVDSSNIDVALRALKSLQGKGIVNSISLKVGESQFLENARRIHSLGAAMVVMAFDEKGQADSFERKIEVCSRAYRLLTQVAGVPSEDIIFDPNILTIATGLPEHDRYALDFIRATAWIKQNLKGAKVSGGVSNLSFAFRGNNYLREAMHAVFLYHAINSGMDMAIVNPGSKVMYDDIEPEFRALLEDVILCRREGASSELIAKAQQLASVSTGTPSSDTSNAKLAWREAPLDERLGYALSSGVDDFLEQDLTEALKVYERPVRIIEGPLMSGMRRVGELFGEGKMFLPQVVKTARTMKKAVAILQPAINAEARNETGRRPKILLATVRGDVHDIGKNIVGIVLSCNGYDVEDLGVMVSAETIVQKALEERPAAIGLSGLITPSLSEMITTVQALNSEGISVPVMVGGAATSALHTALKIAPHYGGLVVHVKDASQNPIICTQLFSADLAPAYIAGVKAEQERLRREVTKTACGTKSLSLKEAREHNSAPDWSGEPKPLRPNYLGSKVLSHIHISEVEGYINWRSLLTSWRLPQGFASLPTDLQERERAISELPEDQKAKAHEAIKLLDSARAMLSKFKAEDAPLCRAIFALLPAGSDGEDLIVGERRFPMLRRQTLGESGYCPSLVDFVRPIKDGQKEDYLGAFAVTGGFGSEERVRELESEGDSYNSLLLQSLAHLLAEATAEWLHEKVRREFWGYASDETLSKAELLEEMFRGIRPAIGYPSIPDQTLNLELDKLLDFSQIGIALTENGAMTPTGSVSGFYFSNPCARYFMVGELTEEAVEDYAERRGLPLERLRKVLAGKMR